MSKQKQKEQLPTMIAKTVLAIAVFTGLGTIIFGGGVVIMKYYNGEVNDRIVKTVDQETENDAYYQENRSEIIDKILPEDYSRELADYSVEDLNNDGVEEIIIISTPVVKGKTHAEEEVYLIIATDVKKDGTHKKVADYYFTNYSIRIMGMPFIKSFFDIDNDGNLEMLLFVGGHMNETEGIFKIDWEAGEINWLEITEYGVSYQETFITFSRFGLETNIRYEDIDNDNMIEVIGEEKRYIYDYFEADISDLENEKNYKITKFVYKWNGSSFVYDKELSDILTFSSSNVLEDIELNTSDWQTYRNEEFGFEIDYKCFNSKVCRPGMDNGRGLFRLLNKDNEIMPYSEFRITILENDKKFSAEKLVESIKKSAGDGPWLSGVNMTEQKTEVNGYDAYVFDNVWNTDSSKKVYFITYKDQAIQISFVTSAASDYDMTDNLKASNQMLSSFKFIEKEDTSDWQIYRNEEYGFEIKHSEEWKQCEGENICFRKDISFDHPRRFTEINIKANQNNQNLSLDKIIFDFENNNRVYEQEEYITINNKKAFKAEIANWGMVSGKQFLIVGDNYWYDIVIDGTNVEDIENYQIISTFKFIEK